MACQEGSLIESKVEEMILEYLKYPLFLKIKNKIIIGCLNTNWYIIDGQHRLLAIKDLIKKNIIIDEEILIQMKKCNSIKEMKKYFKTLNINSKIEIQYHGIENEFYNSLICNFKSKIKSLFLNAFSRTKNVNKTNQFLHIDQFLELFKLISFSLVRSDNSILNSLQILINRSASIFLFPLSIKFK